jgi:hypothetical protein
MDAPTVELCDQETAQRLSMYAAAGLSLREVQAHVQRLSNGIPLLSPLENKGDSR